MRPDRCSRWLLALGITCCLCLHLLPNTPLPAPKKALAGIERAPSPILGDYGGVIREKRPRKDGIYHVDTPKMIERLRQLRVNTYFFLVWHKTSDWDDLRREFLPAAKQAGIDVWVYLIPPSEGRTRRSEPYGTDFIAWARAVGHLSRSFDNLKGIVIDDFNDNLSFFTPTYMAKIRKAARAENPNLKILPQIYYSALSEPLLRSYRPFIDGVIMTFRDDPHRNTQRLSNLPEQIDRTHRLLKPFQLPFLLMIYTNKLSATPANPSAHYVESAIRIGIDRLRRGAIQGLITYDMQKEWVPEREDLIAHSGKGYGCLYAPPVPMPPGSHGEFEQVIESDNSGRYALTFWHMGGYPTDSSPVPFRKRLLINGRVVWQKEIPAHPPNRWQRERVDLTPWLKGQKRARLTLQMYVTGSRDLPVWTYVGFDALRPEGFRLRSPDFEVLEGWSTSTSHPSLLAETLRFDPKRRARVYLSALRLYNAFHLDWMVRQYAGGSILKETSGLMLSSLVNRNTDQAAQYLKQMMYLILTDRNLRSKTGSDMLEQSRYLYTLLQITRL